MMGQPSSSGVVGGGGGGGGEEEERQRSIDVTSLWLSVEVNLLGNGWAYAIVCELAGFTSMDLLFHCLTQRAAAAYRQTLR